MIVLKYGNTELIMYSEYSINKSSQDVKFSDVKCDFTGYSKNDLPVKYQEASIIDTETNEIYFTGYVDSYEFGKMREVDIDRDISITLLSPMSLATLRSATAVGTYMLKDLIENQILGVLIDDGFVIEEMNISDRELSVNFLLETVEFCMNSLSNKYNFWWYIDERKKIYINDIAYMFNKNPNLIYDNDNRPSGLEYIQPKISARDYYNVINFKNVRIYNSSIIEFDEQSGELTFEANPLINQNVSMKNGDELLFNYPVDINEKNIRRNDVLAGVISSERYATYGIGIYGVYSDGQEFSVYITTNNLSDYGLLISDNVGFNGDSESNEKEFLLIRDNFFSNLITGFKYNGNKEINHFTLLISNTALIWSSYRFFDIQEVQKKKGVVSLTGVIEKNIDMSEQWKTIDELQEIGKSNVDSNIESGIEIEMQMDKKNNLNIGDIVIIDRNDLLIDGSYVITEIKENYKKNDLEYTITLKNANMLDSFIDIFRAEESQESEEKTQKVIISEYTEESIKESHEVV